MARSAPRAAVVAASVFAASMLSASAAWADVLISADWPEGPISGDGWYRVDGFTDYSDGTTPTNGAGISRVDVGGGDFALQYVNANGQYWGQIVGQSWGNAAISVANMQANPILEFDLDLSQANWGNLSLNLDINGSTHSYNLSHLTVKNRGLNPIRQHVSLDLSLLSTPIASMDPSAPGTEMSVFFQPAYYGFWDPTANGGSGAWIDSYVTQTYRLDNMWLSSEPPKVNGVWDADADGNWSAGPWAGGTPGGAGHTANFGPTKNDGSTIGARTVTLDAPVTLGVLNFYNPNAQTLAGSSAITLTGSAHVPAAINVAAGNHTISAPVAFTSNVTINVMSAGSTLTMFDLQESTADLVKAGPGTLSVNRIRAAAVAVNGGTLKVAANGTSSGTSVVSGLTFGAGAKLDLSDNDMVINWTGISPLAAIRSALIQGRGGSGFGVGDWNGVAGIAASAASVDPISFGIGYAQNDLMPLGGFVGTFSGQSINANSVIIKYTRGADANLDGVVDDDDVTIVGALYDNGATTGHHWFEGDFDYDGTIDDDDVTALGALYDPAATPLSETMLTSMYGASFAAAFERGQALAAVPEPAGFALLGIGAAAAGLLGRRRRQP